MNPEPSGTLSIYFCGTEPCAPGHAFGPAVRPHYLIHVVLDGKGIYKRNGETYHLKAGDAFLISPMESPITRLTKRNRGGTPGWDLTA